MLVCCAALMILCNLYETLPCDQLDYSHSDLLPQLHFKCTGEVINLLHHTLTSKGCWQQSHKQDSGKAHLMCRQHGLTLRQVQGEDLQEV